MGGSSFGKIFKISTFGESHGKAIGVVIDGCPAGLDIPIDQIQKELDRRRPGQSKISTSRNEADQVEILSGVFDGKSTGTPIGLIIYNRDHRTEDYENIKSQFRPSHADFTYSEKYGIRDYRGGGRSSARETAMRVAAGAIAKLFLKAQGINVVSYVSSVGTVNVNRPYTELNLNLIDSNIVRCPDPDSAEKMIDLIESVKAKGDTIGGVIQCICTGVPTGLGEPVFDKLHAELAKAMMSINATRGFEIGSGWKATKMRGSEHNDAFYSEDGMTKTKTNHSGGIQGGISNGMDIHFKVAFKPVATLLQKQQSINESGEEITLDVKGRHDPCVLPRAVPIVEAMAALVLADFILRKRGNRL